MAHEHNEHGSSLGHIIKSGLKKEREISRAKSALKVVAAALRKSGVSQKTILGCVGTAKKGKKVKKAHDGTFEVTDIDHADENDIDRDEEVGGVRDEDDDLGFDED